MTTTGPDTIPALPLARLPGPPLTPRTMTSTVQDNAASYASSNLDDSNTAEMSKEATALGNAHDESLAQSSPSPRDIHGFRWVLAVVAVVSSILLYATDNTIVRS